MISILDQIVADWGFKTWYSGGETITQVQVRLFNGMTLMMDLEDFREITDDEAY
jgi:hypothetical protein